MGVISFALQGNYKRFYNDLKELSKTTHKPAWFMFLDTAVCTLRYGSGLQDYLNFRFYEKKHAQRKTYVSVGYLDQVITKLSNIKWSPYISNKTNFHKNYGKYTRRDFFDPDGGYEAFEAFLERNPVFIYKPQIGQCGEGIAKIVTAEIEDRKAFFDKAMESKACLEELVKQHPAWEALCPGCVNTLRVITGAAAGQSWLLFAATRVGSGTSVADNFHMGGSAALIDMETGKLTGTGLDKKLNEHACTATGIRYDGYEVPYWEEIKAMCLEAALVNDQIHFIGWDVAITPDGPLLIEGNRGSGFDLPQVLAKRGLKDMLEGLVAKVEELEKRN
ncbi:MAG: hypothetical protein IJX01_06985 [Oscillospiraceae bacterium]|nr:hypothetical protein [Oscillospiraceae bacterium]